MRFVARLSLVLFGLSPASALAEEAVMPSWMAGCWEMRQDDQFVEECWTIPRAGQMMGSGRSGNVSAISSFEFMRIEREGEGLAYRAAPGGGTGWTVFHSAEDPGEGVTFVNSDHDYPQRIRYWREGSKLNAEISLVDGSNASRWSFAPMGGG